MSKDKDYKDILSGTVKEAKTKIRDLEAPDYKKLLKLEREGKDRESLKDFLKGKADSIRGSEDAEEETVEEEEEAEETGSEESVGKEGLRQRLSQLSVPELLVLGGVAGLMVGLLVGTLMSPAAAQGSPDEARSTLSELMSGFNGTVDIGQPETRHGLYYFNVTMTQQQENKTVTRHQQYYVTKNNELLFPVISNPMFGIQTPINVQKALAQQEAQKQQQSQDQAQ